MLASVCGGDLAGIRTLIENEATDEWVRGAALSSLVTLVAAGQKSRDEIVSYFAGLFRGKLVRKWSPVWDTLISYTSDLYPDELLDEIKQAYEDGLVDRGYIGFDDVKHDMAMGKDGVLARLGDNPHQRLVVDTVAEMGWWACFRKNSPKEMYGPNDILARTKLRSEAGPPQSFALRPRPEGMNDARAAAARNTKSAAVLER